METLKWAKTLTGIGEIFLAIEKNKVIAVAINVLEEDFLRKIKTSKRFAAINIEYQPSLELLIKPILEGNVQLELDLEGTSFQKEVWQQVQKIPRGKRISYQMLSQAMDKPRSARAVANALARNRIAILIPCHRVLASSGKFAGYRWGVDVKEKLLNLEQSSIT